MVANHNIIFLTETWIGNWDPSLICNMRKLITRIITTKNTKKKLNKKGRVGCQKAWLVKNDLYEV